jgi:peptidoglycan/LPS O-acetylase OafA/YrhL
MNFDQRLAQYNGIGPGFDFLRVGLAISIVMTHAALLSGRDEYVRTSVFWYTEYALVPMFFALSGFLVAGSAMRLSLKNFLVNRGLRIIPALAVDIVICALIIGPLMTKASYTTYFTSQSFYTYFLNITGWIHYDLPGVFKDNFSSNVNGALWTVPYEIACYGVMSLLIVTGFLKRRFLTLLATLAYLVLGFFVELQFGKEILPPLLFKIIHAFSVSRGAQLLAAFLMGVLCYQYRTEIPYRRSVFFLSVLICLLSMIYLDSRSISSVPNRFIVLPALVYVTIWVGLSPVPIPRFFHTGDYSYGIYLYHDPLLQVLIALLPLSVITGPFGWVILIVFGLIMVGSLATFSWHFIEKPILGLRKKFSFVAKIRGVADAGTTPLPPRKIPDDSIRSLTRS